MKNKNLILRNLLGACIFFAVFVLGMLLFKTLNISDFKSRPLKDIIFEGLFVSIIFFVAMLFWSRIRIKKQQAGKS